MYHKLTGAILLAALCTVPIGCGLKAPKVESAAARCTWILGIDVTPSIKPEQFGEYHRMALESILSRLRPGDTVQVLLIDSDPQKGVKTFSLDKGRTGLGAKAAEIYDHVKAVSQLEGYRGTTNIGGFLSYVHEVVTRAREEERLLKAQGKKAPPAPNYMAVLLSDGKPEGRQTTPRSGDWPDVPVWALGVDLKYRDQFVKLCEGQLKIPGSKLRVISYAAWESGVLAFGREIERPQNRALRDELATGVKPAAGL